jgi:hypothetical protein
MSTTRATTPAEARRRDDEYVRRGVERARDREVRRLRRELFPRVPSDEQRREASRRAWRHLADLGLMSEVVARVLTEPAEEAA